MVATLCCDVGDPRFYYVSSPIVIFPTWEEKEKRRDFDWLEFWNCLRENIPIVSIEWEMIKLLVQSYMRLLYSFIFDQRLLRIV